MRQDIKTFGEVERGQRQLKENIEISTRLIGEAERCVEASRAITRDCGMIGQEKEEEARIDAPLPPNRVKLA